MARRGAWRAVATGVGGLLLSAAAVPLPVHPGAGLEVVATGVPRPLQLILDGLTLLVLSPGAHGDAAGEIYRVDLGGSVPADLSRQPHLRVSFADPRVASLGSLAFDPVTRELFLGEENGTRIHRLSSVGRLTAYATGLHRLGGGSTLAFDGLGRLLIVDYADPSQSPGEPPRSPDIEPFPGEAYRGPLVFRLPLDAAIPLPRRLDDLPPLFPRGWGTGRGSPPPRLISVAAMVTGDVVLLSSAGEVFRLTANGTLQSLARLPPGHGQYHRTNMVAGPEGSVFICGGFHVARIFRVSADGTVTTVADGLADPEGIAWDPAGYLYVAESSLHRILRLKHGETWIPRSGRATYAPSTIAAVRPRT